MDTRRDFLRKAALLAAGGGMAGAFPASIQRALAIDPAPGSTYLDAGHVVILMQENRSFDHAFGSLRGVRGFNDPRAVTLPDGNPVWLQTNKLGETYAPFRLNLKDTRATWMSSLPHTWVDQNDARNGGRHDGWLEAKRSATKDYRDLPLTMGFYNRDDIPFYYALADAFTICDQNFCSSLTGTTPNRLHLWTGTIREKSSIHSKANVRNEDVDYPSEAQWTTFPERLEDHAISWCIYQNELSLPTGFDKETESWLANYGDNPIEWFTQYHVRYSATYRQHLAVHEQELMAQIARAEAAGPGAAATAETKSVAELRKELGKVRRTRARWTDAGFAKLSAREKSLHRRAFSTNAGDPHYREMMEHTYHDGAVERTMQIPKGDVLHQFRSDVRSGKLPTVSWIVAPEKFSDHPSAPWYGAWYISEVLDILTQNPEVWRKTILILCYDENDGYFDHVPPFTPPDPLEAGSGATSRGVDTALEYVRMDQEIERQTKHPGAESRAGSIGLGFRVPLVIASPWSRGGYVNSQVCDHTSILRLLEKVLSHQSGRPITEPNITPWRRTVCSDLSSVFRPWQGEKIEVPVPVDWKPFAGSIHQAQFRHLPDAFHRLSPEEIKQAGLEGGRPPWLPQQEKGTRPACALPYELAVDGGLDKEREALVMQFTAGRGNFGEKASGAPFHVYTPRQVRAPGMGKTLVKGRAWSFAVAAGDQLSYAWPLAEFEDAEYDLHVHGPNGFCREMRGTKADPLLFVKLSPAPSGAVLGLTSREGSLVTVEIKDLAYGDQSQTLTLPAGIGGPERSVVLDLGRSHGWYDFGLRVLGAPRFWRRYAGHVEDGRDSISDPFMGRMT